MSQRVRFTDYGASQRNADLTYGIGVVGITQSPPSINDMVYMLYNYEGRSYVFGRALVSLIIPRCNWPEKHEFVAYCQSERKIEFCSPIDVEELSLRSICEISWHLEKGKPVVDLTTINRLDVVFREYLLEEGVKPSLTGKPSAIENETQKSHNTRLSCPSIWSRFLSWLCDENRQKQRLAPKESKIS